MTSFKTFLLELAKVLEFSTLAPDEKGACLIIMKEGQIPFLFEYDEQLVPNTVLVSCAITSIPIERRADVYEAILKENHRIEETLSVKPDEDMVYLHRRFHPLIQAEELDTFLHSFLERVKQWKVEVEQIAHRPPRSDKIPAPPTSIKVFPYKA